MLSIIADAAYYILVLAGVFLVGFMFLSVTLRGDYGY